MSWFWSFFQFWVFCTALANQQCQRAHLYHPSNKTKLKQRTEKGSLDIMSAEAPDNGPRPSGDQNEKLGRSLPYLTVNKLFLIFWKKYIVKRISRFISFTTFVTSLRNRHNLRICDILWHTDGSPRWLR